MIYPEPRYLPGGDRFVLIEFGNEMNLELNFLAQGLASAIAQQKTKGIIETAPCFASLLVHYEPDQIAFRDLQKEMTSLAASRLVSRKARKRSAKSGARASRRIGMAVAQNPPFPGRGEGIYASVPYRRRQR